MTEILAYTCMGICLIIMIIVLKIYFDTRKIKLPKKGQRPMF
jgi:hypothetical protein